MIFFLMKQINFAVIFFLALLTVYFTLENTAATTVNIFPNISASLPLAALLLISSGIGALGAWLFAGWNGMLRDVDARELETSKKRIKELEDMASARQNVLPFMKFSKNQNIDKDVA